MEADDVGVVVERDQLAAGLRTGDQKPGLAGETTGETFRISARTDVCV
jgi:hypothetical protein